VLTVEVKGLDARGEIDDVDVILPIDDRGTGTDKVAIANPFLSPHQLGT
jgi:hypothetical protein